MTWSNPLTPGHAGYLVGLVPDDRGRVDGFRELTRADEGLFGIYLRVVAVGCTCGWRSERMDAPIDATWRPHGVVVSGWFEQECRFLWRTHAIVTTAAKEEAAKRA